jgi:CHAT domain-containing protein
MAGNGWHQIHKLLFTRPLVGIGSKTVFVVPEAWAMRFLWRIIFKKQKPTMRQLLALALLLLTARCAHSQYTADQYTPLLTTQLLLDSAQYAPALLLAQQAESQLLTHLDSTDQRLHDTYCVAGLCALKANLTAAEYYYGRAMAMPTPPLAVSRAYRHFFEAQVWQLQGNVDSALFFYQKSIELYRTLSGTPHPNIAAAHSNRAALLMDRGQNEAAVSELQVAREVWEANYGLRHPATARALHNTAKARWQQGQYLASRLLIDEVLAIRTEKLGAYHRETAAAYLQSGLSLVELGYWEAADDHTRQARHIADSVQFPIVSLYAMTNLGVICSRQGYHAEALEWAQNVYAIERVWFGTRNDEIATTYLGLAADWRFLGQPDSAFFWYKMALDSASSTHANRGEMLNGMGLAWEGLGQLDSAEVWLLRARAYWLDPRTGSYAKAASSEYNLARIYVARGRYAEAREASRLCRQLFGYQSDMDFSKTEEIHKLLMLFTQESEEFLRRTATGPPLESALQRTLEESGAAIDEALRRVVDEGDGGVLVAGMQDLVAQNFVLCEQMYQRTRDRRWRAAAFDWAERGRAWQLSHLTQKNQASCFPTDLTNREQRLELAMRPLEIRIDSLRNAGYGESTPAVLAVRGQLAPLRTQRHDLREQMRTQHPDCWATLYPRPVALADVAQSGLLAPDQTLLEYVLGRDSAYVLLLRTDTLLVRTLTHRDTLERWVRRCVQEGVKKYDPNPKADNTDNTLAYTEGAVALYDLLVRPIRSVLPDSGRLLIVPDGVLWYVPFEALLSARPGVVGKWGGYRDHWLVSHYAVGYTYSTSLAVGQHLRQRRAAKWPLLVVTPFFEEKKATLRTDAQGLHPLEPLTFSGAECRNAYQIWGGTTPEVRDLNGFLRAAPGHRILHLPTHGSADTRTGEYAWLAFSDPKNPRRYEKLYARDLYRQRFDADLAIVSACQSADGPLRRGEGLVTLARGMAAAGVPCVAATRWNAHSESMTNVVSDFHRGLKAQLPKDVALARAQRAHCARTIGYSDQLPHPFFWAGMICIGDLRAIAK